MTRTGEMLKRSLSARRCMMSSLKKSLTASATGWRTPWKPTRFGPSRPCIRATTRRSSQIMTTTMTMG